MAIDARFLADSGREIYTGNELLVKGCLEVDGGVNLLTGYPGSPVAGFFDCLGDIGSLLKSKGIRAFQSNNEALASAALNGSQMLPMRALAAMKSVGVHVAADALALGTLAGANPGGGAVVIMGEDPWCESTQVPSDSRFICEHLRMAVVEPGSPQELKDWINLSFKLSQSAGLYIGYIVTVAHADGGGTVVCRPNQYPAINTNDRVMLQTDKIPVQQTVLLPPRTWQKELKQVERYAATMAKARELGVNRICPATSPITAKSAPVGFIVTGMAGPYLDQVLGDIGLSGVFPILRMGMSYPADVDLVRQFGQLCRTMIVVEERRSFLEKNIRDTLFHSLPHADAADLAGRLYGKSFPAGPGISETRGLNPSVLGQVLIPFIQGIEELPLDLRNGKLSAELKRLRDCSRPKLQVFNDRVIPRTPTFCPGCPHRDSASVLLEIRKNFMDATYMKRHHARGTVDLVAHGDTGCYTMLMFPPTADLMHNYSGMGLGAGTGSGIDPFIRNKQLVFMGDGTFFHSGQIAISNAIKAGQDITFIILANGTTAMTGHQEHPGTDLDLLGDESYMQNIETIVAGMQGSSTLTVVKLSPAERDEYKQVLETTILRDGVKVIIADKECGITHHRHELKEERKVIKQFGYLPTKTHMNVTQEVCENCLECTKQTACPGLTVIDTDYGRKIDTDLTWCVNDGACERVRASNEFGTSVKPCPSFEQVTILRNRRRRYTLPHMALDKLPDPTPVHDMKQSGNSWRAHMAGVGGMGIGLAAAILVRAGHKQGYRVLFQDKKGLAIRNGGVFSQITFLQESDEAMESSTTGAIPYGKADLLLGIDILEACRATDPREQFRVASKDRTAAVLNAYKQPTVSALLGQKDFDPDAVREEIYAQCREDLSYVKDLSLLCEQRLGSKQFVNIMMLGTAFQLGLIPVSARSIGWAIKDTIRRDHRRNIKAFNIGRKLALEPRALPNKPVPDTWEHLVTNKSRILRKTRIRGQVHAGWFERLVQWGVKQMRDLPEEAKYDLTVRVYDLIQYQDYRLAKRYIELVRNVYRRDSAQKGYAATIAVLWGLAKVMLIKDEPYVSYLLTRYEKKQRDIVKFGIDPSNGDRLHYRHHTSPEFNIGPWRIRLRITTTDWQLKLMAQMKWLRKLPRWHWREAEFREWYISLLERVDLSAADGYEQALKALRCLDGVSGYREVRYPKMDAARVAAELELSQKPKVQTPSGASTSQAVGTPQGV